MNYEELFEKLSAQEKALKESYGAGNRALKKATGSIEQGDLKALPKFFAAMKEAADIQKAAISQCEEIIAQFDGNAYIESGEFGSQLLSLCENNGINVSGEFPVYEIFPFKVSINLENTDLTVNRKRISCLRPKWLVNKIKDELMRLQRQPFSESAFVKELAAAYDLTLLKRAAGKPYAKDCDCYLLSVYDALTPMRRFKRDYDKESYAYDLARLYLSDCRVTDDGRAFQFGPSRNNIKAIRILDQFGAEQFIATIRFYGV